MKRAFHFMLLFLLLFSLAGCSQQQEQEAEVKPIDIAAAIVKSQPGLPALVQVNPEDGDFATWLSDYYLLQAEKVKDGVICYADGVEASEIAVLKLENEKDCKEAQKALEEYIQNRANVFAGYAPQQAAMVKEAVVAARGGYIALMICPESQAAREAFLDCFDKQAESSKNSADGEKAESSSREKVMSASSLESTSSSGTDGAENVYNEEAVLEAWRLKDDSSLSEVNKKILDAAKKVIASEIDDSMSAYEKELAIHDFITDWSRFDFSVFGRSGAEGFAEGSDTPYGVLINQSAMCHGYSATFQLFMDMLDIECITVFGIPGGNGVEHSWNMVKLEGEWYCVDAAWDDPIGGTPGHTYFNVTSDFLRRGSIHRWDESSVPEAEGTAYAYGRH